MKLFCTLIIAMTALPALADEVEARLPYTPNVTEQWMAISWGDRIELVPAARTDSKENTILTSDTSILNHDRLEAAILLKADGSLISTTLDKSNVAWQTTEEREYLANEITQEIDRRRVNIKSLEIKLKNAQDTLRKRAGLQDVSKIYEKIRELDAEIQNFSTNR